jgi:hypothetical protein
VNQFPGINPYLNSLLQTRGTDVQPSLWPAFHSTHVNHIADFLNQQLPPNYTAYSEQALQVGKSGEPVKRLVGVVIRTVDEDAKLGRVVTRIELLSPSNKPGGSDASAYEDKRIETLEDRIPLIEIDYLHETPPVIHNVPDYPNDPGAYPYMMIVSDPRPTWDIGKVAVYGFGVDQVLPTIPIPLLDDEKIAFNFNAVYQHTFIARRFHNLIDDAEEPVRFHTYRRDDQAYIRERMAES